MLVGATGRPATSQRAAGKGKRRGRHWSPLATRSPLHFATSTGSKPPSLGKRPTPQKATFVPLTSFSCPSVTSGNGTGRGGTRARRQRAAIIPQTQLQILYSAKSSAVETVQGGKGAPLMLKELLRRLGLRFLYGNLHEPISSRESFSGVFRAVSFAGAGVVLEKTISFLRSHQ